MANVSCPSVARSGPSLEPPICMISVEEEMVPSTFPESGHLLSSSLEILAQVLDILDGRTGVNGFPLCSIPPEVHIAGSCPTKDGKNGNGGEDIPPTKNKGKEAMVDPSDNPSNTLPDKDAVEYPPLVRGRRVARAARRRNRRSCSVRDDVSPPEARVPGVKSHDARRMLSRDPSSHINRSRAPSGSSRQPQGRPSNPQALPIPEDGLTSGSLAKKPAPQQTWANVARITPKGYNLTYVPPVMVDGELVADIPDDIVQEENPFLKECVVGSFLGKKIYFQIAMAAIRKIWGQEVSDIRFNDEGFYFIRILNEEFRHKVLLMGPISINNSTLLIKQWHPKLKLDKSANEAIPVWIRLKKLPYTLWSPSGIGRVASLIGKPLFVDAQTDSMVRMSFARACVELSPSSSRPDMIKIRWGGELIPVFIEYEWKPNACSKCDTFGHKEGDAGFPCHQIDRQAPAHVPVKARKPGHGEWQQVKKKYGRTNGVDDLQGSSFNGPDDECQQINPACKEAGHIRFPTANTPSKDAAPPSPRQDVHLSTEDRTDIPTSSGKDHDDSVMPVSLEGEEENACSDEDSFPRSPPVTRSRETVCAIEDGNIGKRCLRNVEDPNGSPSSSQSGDPFARKKNKVRPKKGRRRW